MVSAAIAAVVSAAAATVVSPPAAAAVVSAATASVSVAAAVVSAALSLLQLAPINAMALNSSAAPFIFLFIWCLPKFGRALHVPGATGAKDRPDSDQLPDNRRFLRLEIPQIEPFCRIFRKKAPVSSVQLAYGSETVHNYAVVITQS